ncbi:MAG: hypothetical protein ACOCQQ_02785 [Candidatus Nanoarchaeia archaeon]
MSWLSNFIGSRYNSSALFDSVPYVPFVIEPLSLEELDVLVRFQQFNDSSNDSLVKGFSLLRKDVASRRLYLNRDEVYSLDDSLHTFERQGKQKEKTCDYDVNIVARSDSDLLGILSFKWTHFHFSRTKKDSWLYFTRFIDVREDVRDRGLATDLLSFAAQYDVLAHKIIRFGTFTVEGERYVKSKLPTIFNDSKCAVIPSSYSMFPQEYACYFNK